jgi:lambda repressor-like predicted transcriptional regulator
MSRDLQALVTQAIRAEMGAAGLTLRALSGTSGITQVTLQRVMSCKRDMNLEQLDQLSRALACRRSTCSRRRSADALWPSNATDTDDRARRRSDALCPADDQ